MSLAYPEPQRAVKRAREVIQQAYLEAQALLQAEVVPAHLLLGMLAQPDGIAALVLRDLGVTLVAARSAVTRLIGGRPQAVVQPLPLSAAAHHVLVAAVEAADDLRHHYWGTEHLLLGLVRAQDPETKELLASLGIHRDRVEAAVLHTMRTGKTGVALPSGE